MMEIFYLVSFSIRRRLTTTVLRPQLTFTDNEIQNNWYGELLRNSFRVLKVPRKFQSFPSYPPPLSVCGLGLIRYCFWGLEIPITPSPLPFTLINVLFWSFCPDLNRHRNIWWGYCWEIWKAELGSDIEYISINILYLFVVNISYFSRLDFKEFCLMIHGEKKNKT